MIDIHTHILYGVDDGAKTIEESLCLLQHQYEIGVNKVVLTPHYGEKFGLIDSSDIRERFYTLQESVKKQIPEMELYLGSEIFYKVGESLEWLRAGQALTMNDTKYVLIEFNVNESFGQMKRSVEELLFAGYRPIIAHVERYEAVKRDIENALVLSECGAYMQVNMESVTGGFFDPHWKLVKKLLQMTCVQFVASDCHHMEKRNPNLDNPNGNKRLPIAELMKNAERMLSGKYITII